MGLLQRRPPVPQRPLENEVEQALETAVGLGQQQLTLQAVGLATEALGHLEIAADIDAEPGYLAEIVDAL